MRRSGFRRGNVSRIRALLAIGNMSNPNCLQTANPAGIAGTAAGFHVTWFGRLTALGNGNNLFSRLGAAQGWALRQSTASALVFRCANGVGTLVDSSAFTLTGLTNQWVAFVGVHTGTQLQLWANGAQVGSDQAIAGYTEQSNRTYVGAAGSSSPFVDLAGCGGGPGVPSAGNIAEWFATVRARRAIVTMPGASGDHLWPARAGALAPLDTIGSDHFSLVGTGHTSIAERSPVWGF